MCDEGEMLVLLLFANERLLRGKAIDRHSLPFIDSVVDDARGVAVIGPRNSDTELDAMDKAGIRGVRVNLATGGVNDPDEAKRRFSLDDHIKATAGIACRKDSDVIDETPMAYKPIDDVMNAQKDLVEIVHTLRQVVCVKG